MRSAVAILFACVTASACAPLTTTMRPAEVLEPGEVHVGLALDTVIPVTGVLDAIDLADTAYEVVESGESLSEEQMVDVASAVAGLVANSPAFTPEVAVAVGLAQRLEAGLRLTANTGRLGMRYQVLRDEDNGVDMSIGLGATAHATPELDLKILGKLDSSRFDIDAPILFGWTGTIGHFWFGPRLYWSTMRTDFHFDAGLPVGAEAFAEQTGLYVGGQVGASIGYEHLFLAAELTVTQYVGTASVGIDVDVVDPLEIRREIDISGLVLTPSIGLLFRF